MLVALGPTCRTCPLPAFVNGFVSLARSFEMRRNALDDPSTINHSNVRCANVHGVMTTASGASFGQRPGGQPRWQPYTFSVPHKAATDHV